MTVVASNFERKHLDLYETEDWATGALDRHFPVRDLKVWEPAAGNHKMVRSLQSRGAKVTATDIKTYDHAHFVERDFFGVGDYAFDCEAIITNPPYGPGNRLAVKFAELALRRCKGRVALLLTAKIDFGKTRRHL